MKSTYHNAHNRGKTNLGWLDSKHSFSFGQFFNPQLTNFGLLRVLNDDVVAPNMGFGKHPHQDIEIISIPLDGSLRHRDNMGNETIIKEGEIQVMTAGTGIEHSEFNNSKTETVNFLQLWIFPNQKNLKPRYDQQKISNRIKNDWQQILSPYPDDSGVWIHQKAWINLGEFTEATSINYNCHVEANGVYFFIIEGEAEIATQQLGKRDAIGIWAFENLQVKTQSHTKILAIEVPMQ
ncbi:pirin family protein [Psychroflexus sp. ALD_RP9]|uniref:pirin family protein n=1 Tax=Psychroflexus sp. ALD_RP9 TaxID=2777186 RepID=UPI001A8DAABA|nr:pirin family protein [Psychroflexus sp. ALD_RP9]QSS97203.1 pirin family protein [Psychroflexus sp. ALD_RP9]